ncbi:SDR family NAD(P)-dependent oxidoreductase [Elstera litoralis]|nr:SDR family NAD(P)-dependent oxidoreductase [Elstera litoralis]
MGKPLPVMTDRTWLILGASSPIARAFARLVAGQGARLILAGRDTDDLNRSAADLRLRGASAVVVESFDAEDMASLDALAASIPHHASPGGLDIFLAFGLMPEQKAMEADPALALRCLTATFTGAARLLLALAPMLEAGHAGRVIVLGSVAGDRGRFSNYIYGSAKAGLATFCSGLRARLFRSGVTLTFAKPGFLDTGMTWGLPGIFYAESPERAAATLLRAALKGKEELYVPGFWALIMLIIRSVPEKIFKKLSI